MKIFSQAAQENGVLCFRQPYHLTPQPFQEGRRSHNIPCRAKLNDQRIQMSYCTSIKTDPFRRRRAVKASLSSSSNPKAQRASAAMTAKIEPASKRTV